MVTLCGQKFPPASRCVVLQCVAVCCSVLQLLCVDRSFLPQAGVYLSRYRYSHTSDAHVIHTRHIKRVSLCVVCVLHVRQMCVSTYIDLDHTNANADYALSLACAPCVCIACSSEVWVHANTDSSLFLARVSCGCTMCVSDVCATMCWCGC